jgi:hypothetical protein
MAETKYTYSVENDFPNQQVNIDKLKIEISESSIATSCTYIIARLGTIDTCEIFFEDALSQDDEDTLDSLVGAHDGQAIENGTSTQISISASPNQGDSVWFNINDNFIYGYDAVREKWLSANKDYPIFFKKGRTRGMYLPVATEFSVDGLSSSAEDELSDVSSSDNAYMSGKSALITGVFCRSKRGKKDMKFDIIKNDAVIFTFQYDGSKSFIYNNNDLNLEINPYDEIQIYVHKMGAGVQDTLCRLEIAWRYSG